MLTKTIASLLALTSIASSAWIDDYSDILSKYVTPSGVKYAELKANPSDVKKLQSVTEAIAKAKLPSDQNEKLAFYINAYNAWILQEALQKFPGKGIRSGEIGFFKKDRITVAGKKMSFDDLESGRIRKEYNEPRIHFAVNCASTSCPPLLGEPYTAKKLDKQLTKVTQDFLNSSIGVRTSGKTVNITKLFDWYKSDFGKVIPFINKYRKGRIPGNAKIKYQSYDWSFNAAK